MRKKSLEQQQIEALQERVNLLEQVVKALLQEADITIPFEQLNQKSQLYILYQNGWLDRHPA